MSHGVEPEAAAPPVRILDTLRELGELKRIRSAARDGSIAERHFADAWSALVAGLAPAEAWRGGTAAALIATKLGDIDCDVLASVDISAEASHAIVTRAMRQASAGIDPVLHDQLRLVRSDAGPLPDFVGLLARQPRAGVTCPGRPRLLLEPPENHAEHCLVTAVYGVLLAPFYGARPEVVYLAALAHHLHNALIPDSGFAGEVLLGEHLESAFARATEIALAQLPATLAQAVREARTILVDAETPEGRAFHAADTLDRVLQIEQHLRAGKATMRYVLHDMELVHGGPVRGFQDRMLAAMGLAA